MYETGYARHHIKIEYDARRDLNLIPTNGVIDVNVIIVIMIITIMISLFAIKKSHNMVVLTS